MLFSRCRLVLGVLSRNKAGLLLLTRLTVRDGRRAPGHLALAPAGPRLVVMVVVLVRQAHAELLRQLKVVGLVDVVEDAAPRHLNLNGQGPLGQAHCPHVVPK